MEIEAKSVLYYVIEKMGKERIESEIVSTPANVPKIIREIFSTTVKALGPYEYDREKVHSDLVVALLHYLLSACLIQADRKLEYDKGLTLDVIIPSAKQLRSDPKRTLLLAFPKKMTPESIKSYTDELQKVQPSRENIWLIFGNYDEELISSSKEFKTYVPDDFAKGSLKPLSSIIDDIKLFLESHKIKSFKIFPT